MEKAGDEETMTEEEFEQLVAETVRHEIAHHFGMDEGRIRRSEAARKRR